MKGIGIHHAKVPETCEDNGVAEYWEDGLGNKFSDENGLHALTDDQTVIEKLGHKFIHFIKWVWDGFDKAVAWLFCDNNPDHVQTVDVPSSVDTEDEPGCTEDGYRYHVATIDVAGKVYTTVNVETLDQLNHDWGAPSYEWNNTDGKWTCTATRVCENNDTHIETETVTASSIVKTPAKCEDMGVTAYTAAFKNTAFAEQTKDETDIDALNHEWSEPKYEWKYADGKWTCTASRICARDLDHIEKETVTASSKVEKDATCEEKGDTAYTAKFKNSAFETQTKTETDIEKLGHRFINFLKWVWDGFDKLVAWLFCDNDPEHIETVDVPVYEERMTGDEATCEFDGHIYHYGYITVGGVEYETEIVETLDQLGHDWYAVYSWSFEGEDDGVNIPDYVLSVTLVCGNDSNHTMPLDVTMERIDNEDGSVTFIGHCEYDGVDYTDEVTITAEPVEPEEPTPDEPTPDEPTPDEPTPDEPTPDEPTPDTPDTPDVPTQKGLLGDVNNDGVVNSEDALLILRRSVDMQEFTELQNFLGDVDFDGENITSNDAVSVLRYSVGIIDNEKIGTPVEKTVA